MPRAKAPPVSDTALPVVVIDDEQDLLEIMALVLTKNGIPVKAFAAPPPVADIAALEPSVVFTDLLLKGTRGTEVCRALKADARTAGLPVVIMSAHTPREVESAARECKADGYLVKPFDIMDLLRMAKEARGNAMERVAAAG